MTKHTLFAVPASIAQSAHINAAAYNTEYTRSLTDNEHYWREKAQQELHWITPFSVVKNTSFHDPVSIKWFEDGELNVSVNCIDRHLPDKAQDTAIIWESDDPTIDSAITYQQLHDETCKMANSLKKLGVKKGDRVIIYLPMILEAAYAMLACARIGAVHSVVFGGFSPQALAGRIEDCKASCIITADEGVRGAKKVPLKHNVNEAINLLENKEVTTLVVQHTCSEVEWVANRDVWYHEISADVPVICEPEVMNAEDPLFILYTSGSTGKPKGVLHSTAGYLLYAALTHKYTFDYQPGEIYWCTADVGWVTGHSYIIYGPLANGATTLMFEGVPTYPDASRFWQVIDKHQVNSFYTAPTAIRALMCQGDNYVTSTSRSSLRILGSVGEPINEEAWLWYYNIVGNSKCPIVDTWWQTETGGHLITPLPGATALKPGAASMPFFGIEPVILDEQGNELEGECQGFLCIKHSWPGQMRTVYGDHQRFVDTYFSRFPGYYFTGDGAKRDADGYYWVTGRVDDVLNVSGHRLGTAEIENALDSHPKVAEAAVVGIPHEVKGEGIYAFVTLFTDAVVDDTIQAELTQWVRQEIGPIATPDVIHITPGLPKTRSGKIMRRILRKIAINDTDNLGDTNTLTNPEIVDMLIQQRKSA